MTAHELFKLPLDEFHIEIASAYTSALSLRKTSEAFARDYKNPAYSDLYGAKAHMKHTAEIKLATAQRIEKWCKKCVILKYQTM